MTSLILVKAIFMDLIIFLVEEVLLKTQSGDRGHGGFNGGKNY